MALGLEKMQQAITEKVRHHSRGLYVALIFPIAFATLLTFLVARIISLTIPEVGFWPTNDLHVHHYTYGFFILGASGYLALIFSGPRAKFLISLLFGLGLGLCFDEFAMWLKLRGDDTARWEYDGIVIIASFFFLILTVQSGMNFLFSHWPFSKKQFIREHKALESARHKLGSEPKIPYK